MSKNGEAQVSPVVFSSSSRVNFLRMGSLRLVPKMLRTGSPEVSGAGRSFTSTAPPGYRVWPPDASDALATTPPDFFPAPGSRVWLNPQPEKMHLFDAETTLAIQ